MNPDEKYFVIYKEFNGEFFVDSYTKERLEHAFNRGNFGENPTPRILRELHASGVDNTSMKEWEAGTLLIIKGELTVAAPQKVTCYKLTI
jgi:hypothetical protein